MLWRLLLSCAEFLIFPGKIYTLFRILSIVPNSLLSFALASLTFIMVVKSFALTYYNQLVCCMNLFCNSAILQAVYPINLFHSILLVTTYHVNFDLLLAFQFSLMVVLRLFLVFTSTGVNCV